MSISMSERLSLWRGKVEFQGGILGVICAVVTLLMLVGESVTSPTIAQRQAEDRLANLNQVIPKSLYDNNPLHDAFSVVDKQFSAEPVEVYPAKSHGVLRAVAFQVTTIGYGGPILLIMGVDRAGNILGVRVLNHKETPGLADKIEIGKSNWITHFDGASLDNTTKAQWHVKKDGGKFDQFTGATITPRAMVRGIHSGLEFYARQAATIAARASHGGQPS